MPQASDTETAAAGAVLGFLILIGCLGFAPAAVTAIMLAIVLTVIARLSAAQIGGQTGDVCGALEQVGEIAVLLVASTARVITTSTAGLKYRAPATTASAIIPARRRAQVHGGDRGRCRAGDGGKRFGKGGDAR